MKTKHSLWYYVGMSGAYIGAASLAVILVWFARKIARHL